MLFYELLCLCIVQNIIVKSIVTTFSKLVLNQTNIMVVLFLNNSVYLIIWTLSLRPLILSYSITQKQIKKLNQVNKKVKLEKNNI